MTSPVDVGQKIRVNELLPPKVKKDKKSSGLINLLKSDYSVSVHRPDSKSALLGVGMQIGEVLAQAESSMIKSFMIHLPEIEYAIDRFDVKNDGWIITTTPVTFDLVVSKSLSSNVSISCSDIPNKQDCSLYTPLFTKSNLVKDFNNHKHVNISAVATTQNFLTSFLGGYHWIDFHKRDEILTHLQSGNRISLQQDSDVSTGGSCVLINTDGYYFLQKCDVIDPNFFMLFVSVVDSDDNNLVTLNSLTSWQLQGPFAAVSNTTLDIYDNMHGNATFM